MSSGRVLGRGRVLGKQRQVGQSSSASSSAPRLPPSSDSTTSIASSISGTTAQDTSNQPSRSKLGLLESHDLSSHVSLSLPDNAATADASQRIICPICNEQMVTLLQLNRHLDDIHQNLEEVQQVEVKNWFQEQVDKAKKLPALAVLEQKFKALDVFESNTPGLSPSPGPNSASRSAISGARSPVPNGISTPPPPIVKRDPEEEVTRRHWQRPSYNDVCADTLCEKRLGGNNGSVNCRSCGKLFCEDHTMYQMKLSQSAKHDPVRGAWCRVCETCYKSRDGYNDSRG